VLSMAAACCSADSSAKHLLRRIMRQTSSTTC
jgi:hypothetical protein